MTGSGYKGWGPGDDALKRYEAESAREALALLEEFEAQDIQFRRDCAKADCPACDGTGKSRATAELLAAFRTGDAPESRWDGWGDRLTPEESAELDRLLDDEYGLPHSVASARDRALAAAPRKAVELGAPETCQECEGDGHVRLSPNRLRAAVWVADARAGISFGVDVPDVSAEEAPDLFTTLARHGARKERLAEIDRFEDIAQAETAPAPTGKRWSAPLEFEDIPEFLREFEELDPDYNLVQAVLRQPGSDPADGLTVSMAHPRKGGLRRCRIASANCGEADWRRFTAMLGEAARIHERHFAGVRAASLD